MALASQAQPSLSQAQRASLAQAILGARASLKAFGGWAQPKASQPKASQPPKALAKLWGAMGYGRGAKGWAWANGPKPSPRALALAHKLASLAQAWA